jgi:nicotinamidase-related amidase
MSVALLIIDMQRGAYGGTSRASMDSASETINQALELFRARGFPVVWVQDVSGRDVQQVRDEPFDCIDALKPLAEEARISKRYWNTFNKTDCLELLRSRAVDTVIISGYCAECCVLSTYRGAMDADLTPLILRDGIASGDEENLAFVERISDTVSLSALRSFLPSRDKDLT